jgi:hypothetical protein
MYRDATDFWLGAICTSNGLFVDWFRGMDTVYHTRSNEKV